MSFSPHHWHEEDRGASRRCCMCGTAGAAEDSAIPLTCDGAIGAGRWRPSYAASWSAWASWPSFEASPPRAAA